MVYRKGELTKAAVDHGWPHQVALPEHACIGHHFKTVHFFCEAEKLSPCQRGHSFKRDGVWFNVFCFAEREHADRFHARFAGEWIDQSKRPRWPGDVMR